MKAKFVTKESLTECLKHSAPQAISAIIIGLVVAVMALTTGITLFTLKNMIAGGLLLASLMMISLIILYYGFFGANQMIKGNTILLETDNKETILTDDKIIEITCGSDSRETREFDYKYINSARYSKGMFALSLTDGTSILFSADKIVEGDIGEVRAFLYSKFGKAYIDKSFVAEIDFQQTNVEVGSESIEQDKTNIDDESNNK